MNLYKRLEQIHRWIIPNCFLVPLGAVASRVYFNHGDPRSRVGRYKPERIYKVSDQEAQRLIGEKGFVRAES